MLIRLTIPTDKNIFIITYALSQMKKYLERQMLIQLKKHIETNNKLI